MHKVRATTLHLRTGSTNRIGVKPWLSCTKCAPFRSGVQQKTNAIINLLRTKKTTFCAVVTSPQFKARHSAESIPPKKMLEAETVEPRLSFLTPVASSCCQRLINGGRGFPFGIVFQESRCVESRFVIPEEFAATIGACLTLQDFVKRRKRARAVGCLL